MSSKSQAEMKDEFWTHLSNSPIVMLELDSSPHTASPMTAQLDKDARHAIWFFTSRDGALRAMGAATATFSSKDHKLFARFVGQLSEEKDRTLLDKHWSNPVAAWFPEGKESPNLLFLRMDLGEASIWSGTLGALGLAKMLLGIDVRQDAKGQHGHARL